MESICMYVGYGFEINDIAREDDELFEKKYRPQKLQEISANYYCASVNHAEAAQILRPLGESFILFNELFLFSKENQNRPNPIKTFDDMSEFLRLHFPASSSGTMTERSIPIREYWIYTNAEGINHLRETLPDSIESSMMVREHCSYFGCGFDVWDIETEDENAFTLTYGAERLDESTAQYIANAINKKEGVEILRPIGNDFVFFNERILFSEENHTSPYPIRTWDDMDIFLRKYFPCSEELRTLEYWKFISDECKSQHICTNEQF